MSGHRAINHWAEPDQGNGVSGPPTSGTHLNHGPRGLQPVINNSATPFGGPLEPSDLACPWSTNNCGPNDQIFSYHPGGARSNEMPLQTSVPDAVGRRNTWSFGSGLGC